MRLGDDIDDYCSRCKRITDHSIVFVDGETVKKTRCRTCGFEHVYKKAKSGKKEITAQDAFDTLLRQARDQVEQSGKKKH